MDEYFYQKYQNSKQLRFINGMVVVPVAYCKTCNPMCHSPTVNLKCYTKVVTGVANKI